MRLTDAMSAAGLTIYPIISLVLFALVFIAVVWRTYVSARPDELESLGRLPIDDPASAPDHDTNA